MKLGSSIFWGERIGMIFWYGNCPLIVSRRRIDSRIAVWVQLVCNKSNYFPYIFHIANVNSVPSRSKLNQEIQSAEDELRSVRDSLIIVDQTISTRQTQYDSLLAALALLQTKLVPDRPTEEMDVIVDERYLEDGNEDDEEVSDNHRRGREGDNHMHAGEDNSIPVDDRNEEDSPDDKDEECVDNNTDAMEETEVKAIISMDE